jgi:hypothetical protein
MKIFKKVIEQVLKKNNFNFFNNMNSVFIKIFSTYNESVVFIKITDKILFIGVKIPQLIAHFTSLKQYIINQFIAESILITDIKFFYYNQLIKKNNIKNFNSPNDQYQKQIALQKKIDIDMILLKNCHKSDYRELLYKLFIKLSQYEK